MARPENDQRHPARSNRGESGDALTIRDLASEFGVTSRTLRFYEEKGLLNPRRLGLERLYSRRDRARLKYVLMGKSVGFSLDEVREMLDLYDLGDGQITQLSVALEKFRERIVRLERQKAEIERVLDELNRASETVTAMLAGSQPSGKPRVRMKAARNDVGNGSNIHGEIDAGLQGARR
jgi:DNA-binding transcriptional MerR regulator